MDTAVIIALFGLVISAASFFVGRISAAKNNGVADGEHKADIKYIKDTLEKQDAKFDKLETKIDGFGSSYENVKIELEKVKGRVFTLEQKVKMLHGE